MDRSKCVRLFIQIQGNLNLWIFKLSKCLIIFDIFWLSCATTCGILGSGTALWCIPKLMEPLPLPELWAKITCKSWRKLRTIYRNSEHSWNELWRNKYADITCQYIWHMSWLNECPGVTSMVFGFAWDWCQVPLLDPSRCCAWRRRKSLGA